MSTESKYVYSNIHNHIDRLYHIIFLLYTVRAVVLLWINNCYLYCHAAFAVNKTSGGALWHTFALSMAIANSTPGLAGNSHIVLPPQTKWAGRSNPAIMFTTSTVSKLTTVTPTSLSFPHLPMLKSTTNNFQNQTAGGRNAAQSFDNMFVSNVDLKMMILYQKHVFEIECTSLLQTT